MDGSARRVKTLLRDLGQLVRAHAQGRATVSYESLVESEARHRLLADGARDIIWRLDYRDASLAYVSPAVERILGWTPEEQMSRRGGYTMLTPDSAAYAEQRMRAAVQDQRAELTYEAEHLCKDGGSVWCEVQASLLYDEQGRPSSCIGVTRDISERRGLQEQLLQAQKLEALGLLAGGIAHDFNNYLTVILGALEGLEEAGASPTGRGLIDEAASGAAGAAKLTRAILGFARRRESNLVTLDLNELVIRTQPVLERLLRGEVRVVTRLAEKLHPVRADPEHLEQVLFNLALNAYDADAACLRIETEDVFVDRDHSLSPPQLSFGHCVELRLLDDGAGMEPEILARATEAFFTTKEPSRGTGLGLASARSSIERFGGDLGLESEPGRGSCVRITLPRARVLERITLPRARVEEA